MWERMVCRGRRVKLALSIVRVLLGVTSSSRRIVAMREDLPLDFVSFFVRSRLERGVRTCLSGHKCQPSDLLGS